MTRLIALILILFFCQVKIDAQKINLTLSDKILASGGASAPSLKLTSISSGDTLNLADFGKRNLKYTDKPTLLYFWAKKWCGSVCYKRLDTLLEKQIDRQFNIIAVNVEGYYDGSEGEVSVADIKQLIAEKQGWNKIVHYQTSVNDFTSVFFEGPEASTPFWVILDKNEKIVTTFTGFGLPIERFNQLLQDIEIGRVDVSAPSFYVDREEFPVAKSKAYAYYQRNAGSEKVSIKKYLIGNSKLLREFTVRQTKGNFVYDGVQKANTENGTVSEESTFQNGYRLRGKKWHDNGELKEESNVPFSGTGYIKSWRADGTSEKELNLENGELNGISREFDASGNVKNEFQFRAGRVNGTGKEYVEGILYKEYQFKDGSVVSSAKVEKNLKAVKQACLRSINILLSKGNRTEFKPEVTDDGLIWPANNGNTYTDSRGEHPGLIRIVKWGDMGTISAYRGELKIWCNLLMSHHKNFTTEKIKYNGREYGSTAGYENKVEDVLVPEGDELRVKELLEFIKYNKWE